MPIDPPSRPSPERILQEVEEQERMRHRGRLKIFLGYTSGVGKSFQMFDEGRRRRERNREDVVVGAIQPKYPPNVQLLLANYEIIPPLRIGGEDAIDVASVLKRRPQTVLVDGLAYGNPPGSQNAQRWQDVEQLLDAGISVISSINLQYVDECRQEVERITGKHVEHTIPKSFLERADEIVVVDAPAEVSVKRAGAAPVSVGTLLVEEQKLLKLREMALLVAAEVVDRQLENYLKVHRINPIGGVQERILVCITPRSDAVRIMESGRRNAERFHGELLAVYVKQRSLTPKDAETLRKNLDKARELGSQVEVLEEGDPVDAIIRFAHEKGVSQIFVGHSTQRAWWRRLWGGKVDRLIRAAEGIDVIIYPLPGSHE